MAFYHWSAQHPLDPLPGELPGKPSDREEMGIEYLKLQKVLSGSYHQEKADYCHEMYVFHRGKAEESEQELAAGAGTLDLEPGVEDRVRQRIGKSRSWAANWLRTEANCLEMPDGQNDLTAPLPQQTDH